MHCRLPVPVHSSWAGSCLLNPVLCSFAKPRNWFSVSAERSYHDLHTMHDVAAQAVTHTGALHEPPCTSRARPSMPSSNTPPPTHPEPAQWDALPVGSPEAPSGTLSPAQTPGSLMATGCCPGAAGSLSSRPCAHLLASSWDSAPCKVYSVPATRAGGPAQKRRKLRLASRQRRPC